MQGTLTAGCVHRGTMRTPPQLQPGNNRDAKGRKVRGSWHGMRGGVKAGVGHILQQDPVLPLGGAADPLPGHGFPMRSICWGHSGQDVWMEAPLQCLGTAPRLALAPINH